MEYLAEGIQCLIDPYGNCIHDSSPHVILSGEYVVILISTAVERILVLNWVEKTMVLIDMDPVRLLIRKASASMTGLDRRMIANMCK
jgi:hypothetical protein